MKEARCNHTRTWPSIISVKQGVEHVLMTSYVTKANTSCECVHLIEMHRKGIG
jgi:hypothetical protein